MQIPKTSLIPKRLRERGNVTIICWSWKKNQFTSCQLSSLLINNCMHYFFLDSVKFFHLRGKRALIKCESHFYVVDNAELTTHSKKNSFSITTEKPFPIKFQISKIQKIRGQICQFWTCKGRLIVFRKIGLWRSCSFCSRPQQPPQLTTLLLVVCNGLHAQFGCPPLECLMDLFILRGTSLIVLLLPGYCHGISLTTPAPCSQIPQ